MKKFIPLLLALVVFFSIGKSGAASLQMVPEHSNLTFTANSLMANTTGKFEAFKTTVQLDNADPLKSTLEVEVDIASITTGNQKRDKHLLTDDFFDVAQYPKATFKSKSITALPKEANYYLVTGDLTMHGVTKEIELVAMIKKDGDKVSANGTASINRKAFGIDFRSYLNPTRDLVLVEFTVELK